MRERQNEKKKKAKSAEQTRASLFGIEFGNWARINWKNILGYVGYPVFFFAWFYVSQARIEHAQIQTDVFENNKKFELLDEKIASFETYQILTEKKWAEMANKEDEKGNKELAENIRKLLDVIQQQRK